MRGFHEVPRAAWGPLGQARRAPRPGSTLPHLTGTGVGRAESGSGADPSVTWTGHFSTLGLCLSTSSSIRVSELECSPWATWQPLLLKVCMQRALLVGT